MKNKVIFQISIVVLCVCVLISSSFLSKRGVSIKKVDSYFENMSAESERELCNDLLISMQKKSTEKIGITKDEIHSGNISKYNPSIASNKSNRDFLIMHSTKGEINKEYITIFGKKTFTYSQIGTPLEFRTVLDIFLLPINTDEKYIIFIRELDGVMTSPLDVSTTLHAYVYDNHKNTLIESIKIIENMEEYTIVTENNKNRYKKYRTKSDIILTNKDYPIMEILTYYYEAISGQISSNDTQTPSYSEEFDVIKTSNSYEKYFYDPKYKHFLLGYLRLTKNNEKVGILKKNSKIIDNNYVQTYTVIRNNGEIFEVFSDFSIEK